MDFQIERLKILIEDEIKEKQRAVVFWIDPEGEWSVETLDHVLSGYAKVEIVTATNFLTIKQKVERENPEQSFVLYTNEPLTAKELEPLTSLLLSGAWFKHDDTIALAERLNSDEWSLRQLQQEYPKFFGSQARVQKLERIVQQFPQHSLTELSLISAITGSEPNFLSNLFTILAQGINQNENKHIQSIRKFGLLSSLKNSLETELGITGISEEYLLQDAVSVIITSNYSRDGGLISDELKRLVSTKKNQIAAVYEQMIQNKRTYQQWNEWTDEFTLKYGIESVLADLSLKQLVNIKWFSVVDKILLKKIATEMVNQSNNNHITQWVAVITQRLQTDLVPLNREIKSKYRFWLIYMSCISLLQEQIEALQLGFQNSEELYGYYISKGYRLDEQFRQLSVLNDALSNDSYHELFIQLQVEYEREWLEKISVLASSLFSHDDQPEQIQQQINFYHSFIHGNLHKSRQFVIISDAFRYEAGKELEARLQFHQGCSVKCEGMLSSAPTYTQLGMASLLPQIGPIAIGNSGTLLMGGFSTSGIENP